MKTNNYYYYKVKVYSSITLYPLETYKKSNYKDAEMLFRVMKELDPYQNKRIELIKLVEDNKGNLMDWTLLREFN
jgi:hypothetical protein